MDNFPDFQLLTSFNLIRADGDYTKLVKEYAFQTPNQGVIGFGCVLNNLTWLRAGYVYPLFDLLTTGERLVGSARQLRQSNSYSQFQVMDFQYRLIGFKLVCFPWIDSISCEVHLGIIK
jgi:hypothetical protein